MAATRIDRRMAKLKQEGRPALVTYFMGGDPDYATSLSIMQALPGAGADIIELGMPFSDPMADGPAIQEAGLRALHAGQTLVKTLSLVSDFRKSDDKTPVVLMGYYNPIYVHGVERFLKDAKAAGVDGLIIVDLPPEEAEELAEPLRRRGLDFIFLAAPTTNEARLPAILAQAGGFLYYVSITGVTGTASAKSVDVRAAIDRLRRHTDLPLAVGFGIKTAAQVAEIAKVADAAVVGSAIVSTLAAHLDPSGRPKADLVPTLLAFVGELAKGTVIETETFRTSS